MTTELLEEVQTPVETVATPEVAVETPAVDVVDTPEADPLEEYYAKEGLTETPETPVVTASSDPAPEVLAQAEKIASERLATQRAAQEEASLIMSFRESAPRVRNYLAQQGVPQQVAEQVIAHLSGIQSNAKQVYTKEAQNSWTQLQINEAEKLLPKFSEGKYTSTAEFVKGVVDKARDGYISPKQVEAKLKAERIAEHKRLTENPAILRSLLSKAEAPKTEGGNTLPSNGRFNPETSSISEVDAALKKLGL